jgi:hypothetical protein
MLDGVDAKPMATGLRGVRGALVGLSESESSLPPMPIQRPSSAPLALQPGPFVRLRDGCGRVGGGGRVISSSGGGIA